MVILKNPLSHTHTSSHSHAHVHAQMYAHTHTHTPNQLVPHLAPAPTTSLSRKKAKKCISCSSLTGLPSGACSRCQQQRRTLLKPENVAPIHVDGSLVHFTDRFVYLDPSFQVILLTMLNAGLASQPLRALSGASARASSVNL